MKRKVWKFFKRLFLGLLSLIVLLVLATWAFFSFAPQIGGEASGERLRAMQASPQYDTQEEVFVNQIKTVMDMGFDKTLTVAGEYMGEDPGRDPQQTFETKTFDAEAYLAASDDSLASVTWFGHSTVLLQVDGKLVLTDPVLSERASMFPFMGPKRFDYSYHLAVQDLPALDVVLISHDHYDHLDYESIQALSEKTSQFLVPLGVGAHLEAWGVPATKIKEMDWWQETSNGSVTFTCTPSRHFSGRALSDRNSTLWSSWVIAGEHQKLYFSGDTGYGPHFAEIGQRLGPFDFTMMECGAYSQYWDNIHLMPEETAQANLDLQGRVMMPIHWGKFNLSLHAWKEPVLRLLPAAEALGQEVVTPVQGQRIYIPGTPSTEHWWEAYQ